MIIIKTLIYYCNNFNITLKTRQKNKWNQFSPFVKKGLTHK